MSCDLRQLSCANRAILSPEVWTHLFIDTCNHVQRRKLTKAQVKRLVREATVEQKEMLRKRVEDWMGEKQ